MALLEEISSALKDGKVNEVQEGVRNALAEGIEPEKILNEGLLEAMSVIGEKFKNNEIFVPEVLIAARAMNGGMEILKPRLIESGVKARGTVVLGTVKGDLHDIGKNLVKMMMEGAGFEVKDLGTDVGVDEFVETVKNEQPDVVGMSALLTTTMGNMQDVIKALEEAGLRDNVFVMIGGAPVTDKYAIEIGADAYSKDAASAATTAKEVI